MSQRFGQIAAAAAASVGALILTSCATNTDEPETFAATVTVAGEADRVVADSGECTIGENHVAPNDHLGILGDGGSAFTSSALEVRSIEQNPNGTGVCTYVANFAAIPANQRSYVIALPGFAEQSFTSGELASGATYHLHSS